MDTLFRVYEQGNITELSVSHEGHTLSEEPEDLSKKVKTTIHYKR